MASAHTAVELTFGVVVFESSPTQASSVNRSHETTDVTCRRQPRVSVSKISEKSVKVATHPQACRSTRPCCSPGRCTPAWSPRSREASATCRRFYRSARCHGNDLSITGQRRSRFKAFIGECRSSNIESKLDKNVYRVYMESLDSATIIFILLYILRSYFLIFSCFIQKRSAQSGLVSCDF